MLRERLGRVVANYDWINLFSRCVIQHLDLEEFIHVPILINLDGEEEIKWRPFKFLQA